MEKAVALAPSHTPSLINLADLLGTRFLARSEELYEGALRLLESGPASATDGGDADGLSACLQGLSRICVEVSPPSSPSSSNRH